jgi:hypothetical protein
LFKKVLGSFVKGMREIKGYTHTNFQMEKIMPSFEYEPLVLFLKPKTSNEEKDKGNIDGAGPLSTKIIQEEL